MKNALESLLTGVINDVLWTGRVFFFFAISYVFLLCVIIKISFLLYFPAWPWGVTQGRTSLLCPEWEKQLQFQLWFLHFWHRTCSSLGNVAVHLLRFFALLSVLYLLLFFLLITAQAHWISCSFVVRIKLGEFVSSGLWMVSGNWGFEMGWAFGAAEVGGRWRRNFSPVPVVFQVHLGVWMVPKNCSVGSQLG